MNYRETVKEELECQQAVLGYALKIVNFFSNHDPKHHNMLSMSSFLDSIPDGRNDIASFSTALLYLSHSKNPLLEMEFKYFDEASECYLDIDMDDIHEAENSGILYHPDSGVKIENYKEKIIIFYKPCKIASEIYGT